MQKHMKKSNINEDSQQIQQSKDEFTPGEIKIQNNQKKTTCS